MGDDETYTDGLAKARAALGRPPRPRPRAVPDPVEDTTVAPDAPVATDDLRGRVAQLEAENRVLRAALARIADDAHDVLDD